MRWGKQTNSGKIEWAGGQIARDSTQTKGSFRIMQRDAKARIQFCAPQSPAANIHQRKHEFEKSASATTNESRSPDRADPSRKRTGARKRSDHEKLSRSGERIPPIKPEKRTAREQEDEMPRVLGGV